ncbi:hypothetical protein GRF29_106g276124 [Pseudopithomyces chartarum]|uniref:Uncharacterized protein n=1 Tax=Pseudopithomyces chartarum TaxID=1892770 RepID=A0AAN6LVT5_9PLEO|nr:hypothetical protein GRF29_106g276124 [Pseudopithomyces chartarum]
MPPRRQLPWASKGNSKTPVRQPTAKRAVPADIDDGFFDGTILERSPKSKRRAVAQLSDDELPNLSSSFAETSRKSRDSINGADILSSSPPPIAADLPPPKTEYMLTGVDKFDLRDDEWMMVEDELLQTAKLFTQHLHLAEYETLKTKIEEQKNIVTPRPVVAGAKLSAEGQMKVKAKEQIFEQRKAMKKVLSAQDQSSDTEPPPSSPLPPPLRRDLPRANSSHPSHQERRNHGSDSDDLDVPSKPTTTKSRPTGQNIRHPPPLDQAAEKPSEVLKKPATPAHTRNKPSRGQRQNLWDDWDELTFDSKTSPPKPSFSTTPQRVRSPSKAPRTSSTPRASSPRKPMHTPTPTRTGHGFPTSIKGSKNSPLDVEVDETPSKLASIIGAQGRPERRKVDRKKEKTDDSKFDDIPTFLF